MEDTGRVRLIIIGIILAIVAGGYFLFTQANRVFKARTQSATNQKVVSVASPSSNNNNGYNVVVVSPSPSATFVAKANSQVAGNSTTIASGSLPKTGFPEVLTGSFALSAAISGFFLRKYPK